MTIRIGNTDNGSTGVVTNADNGLSVAATIVELGGTLIKNTDIDPDGFTLNIVSTTGTFQVSLGAGVAASLLSITSGAAILSHIISGDVQRLKLDINGSIFQDDHFSAGLAYQGDYQGQGLIKYAGRYIPCALDVPIRMSAFEAVIQTASINVGVFIFTSLMTAIEDPFLRLTTYMHVDIAGGSGVKITATFTNLSGNPQTIDLTPIVVTTGSLECLPASIKCLRNTQISIDTVVSGIGGITYDVGCWIERLYF